MYNKLSFYQDRDRLGTNIIGELQKEIRVFSEEIEFEVLEEDEEELPPAAAAAAAVGFAGAASAGVVRALKRSLLPRGQRSVYRDLRGCIAQSLQNANMRALPTLRPMPTCTTSQGRKNKSNVC